MRDESLLPDQLRPLLLISDALKKAVSTYELALYP